MANISNQSYFIKRLKDSGYRIDKIFDKYPDTDKRCWTVMIDMFNACLYCTYIENDKEIGNNYFEFYDSSQYIPGKYKLITDSMEVVIKHLNNFGIISKYEKK